MFWLLKVLNGRVSALYEDQRYGVMCLFMVCLKEFQTISFWLNRFRNDAIFVNCKVFISVYLNFRIL